MFVKEFPKITGFFRNYVRKISPKSSKSTLKSKSTKKIDKFSEKEENPPFINKKQKAREENFIKTRWHLRQNNTKLQESKIKEQPKEEKQITVLTSIKNQIEAIFAGRRRGSKHLEAIQSKKVPPHIKFLFTKGNVSLLKSASSMNQLPNSDTNEVCFAGRSNVGKSSLLNSVANCGKASVSDRPGHTRTIDFYRVSRFLKLVDLPGYGFAFVDEEKSGQWNEFVREYIKTRKSLKRVFILVDSRHGLKEKDKEFVYFLEKNNITNHVVLTKTDLLYPDELAKVAQQVTDELKKMKHSITPISLISSRSRSGVLELQREITGLIERTDLSKLKDECDKNVLAKTKDVMKEKNPEKVEATIRFKKSRSKRRTQKK